MDNNQLPVNARYTKEGAIISTKVNKGTEVESRVAELEKQVALLLEQLKEK